MKCLRTSLASAIGAGLTSSRARAVGARLGDTRGFMLIELLVGTMLALVVFGATMAMIATGMTTQASVQSRASQLQEAQVATARLVRDLRQASSVTVVSSSSITYSEPVASGLQSYTFSCSAATQQCTRTTAGTSVIAVSDVSNSDIFTGTPSASSPNYVGVKMVITSPTHTPVTVTDGAELRNVSLGS